MLVRVSFWTVSSLLSVLLLAHAAQAEPDAAWVARMDAMASALSDLSPLLVQDAPWDVQQQERVRADVRALESVAHDLAPGPNRRFPDQDPTLPLLTRELNRALDDAKKASGEKLKADALLLVATCIGCHTRADLGAPKPRATLPPVKVPEQWLKADVLLATRRFQEARATYRAVVADQTLARERPALWERAVKHALVVEIRTARDPRRALEIADAVARTPGAESLKQDAVNWQRDIKSWMMEKPAPNASANELYREANRLMDTAASLQRPPGESGNDVLFLRATALLHQLLAYSLDPSMRAQALSWLAIAYEGLRDLDVWSLFLVYNEACVEAAPRSALATECYDRLERLLLVEHTGNGGGPLPEAEQQRLNRLKTLLSPR